VLAVGRALDALAYESERLRTAERERLVHRRVAHDVGLRVRDCLVVDEVEQAAVSEIGTSFGVDRVLLRRTHDGSLGPVTAEWHEVDLDPLDDPGRAAIAEATDAAPARALWDGVEVAIHDVVPGTDSPWPPAAAGLEAVVSAGNVLVLAFGAGQDVLGTLTLLHATPRDWSAAEVSALESIAADVGRAWQHAALYGRERRLVRELQELDRTKTDFMSTVSHELRTPLTSITGYVELLRDEEVGPVTPDQMRMLDAVGRNADRLLSLIEDLLALSHIESRGFRAQVVPVDVASLLHNAGSAVEPQAAAAGVALTLRDERTDEDRAALGPAQVIGDPGQLDRVLLNLLSNAVKFTPAGGRVELTWSLRPDEVVVHVRDTGIGVPEQELAQLGTRFYRASNATSAAIQGTGLGLTIVRGILEQHGGTLELSSVPGEGTDACVRLPRPPADAGERPHDRATGREQTHPGARL
jgi:two-component system phosphate regulon sensor histidine kinase PhoR